LARRVQDRKNKKENKSIWLFYLLLLILLILFVITKNTLLGALFVAIFVVTVVIEVRSSVKEEGFKRTAVEAVSAIAAIILIWLLVIFILGTTSPIDVVPSCSMLPSLRVGDVVFLHGISNMSRFILQHNIPIVNVSNSDYSRMLANINGEYLAFFAYVNGNRSRLSYIMNSYDNYSIGLYNTKCLNTYAYLNQRNNFYKCYVRNESQASNLIRYSYSTGNVLINGQRYRIIYTSSISVGNTTIAENYSNPIVVYSTTSNDTFSGDIVHRVFAALNVSNTYYLLTKGDNNEALDLEFGNYPPGSKYLVGYVIGTVPLVGYITLAFKGGISMSGCNQTIQR
jgi:signal peptidase I